VIQCSCMDKETKTAFAKLTKTMQDGFASLEARMEKGFAAVAEDIADVKDRLTAVESKVAGTNRRLDEEAMLRTEFALPKRVSDLEEKTFGASRHPKHLPLK
jgi:chemotaxis regulatin CheY-phosphate phosphatase CheZ